MLHGKTAGIAQNRHRHIFSHSVTITTFILVQANPIVNQYSKISSRKNAFCKFITKSISPFFIICRTEKYAICRDL